MLPTFSGHATHLGTLTPSLPYAKHTTPDVQNEHKKSDWQSESVLDSSDYGPGDYCFQSPEGRAPSMSGEEPITG